MFEYSCLHFPTNTFPRPIHTHLPPSIPPAFGSIHGSLIHVHLRPFPFFPTLFPSPLPSSYCQFPTCFSMSLVLPFIWQNPCHTFSTISPVIPSDQLSLILTRGHFIYLKSCCCNSLYNYLSLGLYLPCLV